MTKPHDPEGTLKITNKLFAAAALSLATVSGAAFAQAANVQAGATVYDPQGGTVGTVDSVTNGVAVVNTGAHTVALPLGKFATSEKGPVISVTKQELDDIAAKADADAAAKVNTALVAGAAVTDNAGVALGTIDKVEGDNVVLKTEKGPVALTRKYFAVRNGALMALVTKDQILAALNNATAATTETAAADTAATS
jgi:preprotein translocase subunit YajC